MIGKNFVKLITIVLIIHWGCSNKVSSEKFDSDSELEDVDFDSREENQPLAEVEEIGDLEQSLIEAGLVDVAKVIEGVFVDLKYSTTDNFFGIDVYGDLERCYLQPVVAEMLHKAHAHLQSKYSELTFLIYDGVRPLSVQQILWDNLQKPDSIKPLYVADPKIGGLHNYAVAVDLTLADKNTGLPLDLGTEYDYFGYPAYPDREDQMLREGKITKDHIANRKILREAMAAGGFTGIGSEWWHFNAFSRKAAAEKFDLIK
ncbi:M15 family metallopeptidase [Belliella kenyensis]|uniref:D-alanyl-D-alanine dipeptidase n=1 Tax=Belliella kenyensis TaxID=1472724 RepID=A0ABV8EPV5_9BACT|nr:M15 family metallopeptidase [Belliella kenyensis]MCH7401452.1 M15 family metallopeptidase [Belliella kenyensis]MDN3603268.1 M15 family metallopeptidase [Belliella kenyensis]